MKLSHNFYLLFLPLLTTGAPSEDEITTLPGYSSPLPAPQYSGFLDATSAPALQGGGSHIHYWFAAYEGDKYDSWKDAPIILWLNGGPGSTSMLGFLQEAGPLLLGQSNNNGEVKLVRNPYAWTNVANLVAFESPGGVGYSYCDDMLDNNEKGCVYNDVTTAKANAAAVRALLEKFPELSTNKFYVAGESYAGVYVPTLVKEILDGNDAGMQPVVNVQGLMVGDPCTDNESQELAFDMLWYGHKHGFVPDGDFDLLWNRCGTRAPGFLSSLGVGQRRKDGNDDGGGNVKEAPFGMKLTRDEEKRRNLESKLDDECTAAERKFLLSTSKGFSQTWSKAFINNLSLYGPSAVVRYDVPGSLDKAMSDWMMSDEVRAAIHTTQAPVTQWPGPNNAWDYQNSYAACSNLKRSKDTPSMIDIYQNISPRLPGKIMVLNGDTDPCVSYEGTRTAIKSVGFKEVSAYRPWFYNATAASLSLLTEKDALFGPALTAVPTGPQLGGHVVDYEHGLSFATVHGAGHMFPQFRPRPSLTMLNHVLEGEMLAPALPADGELVGMSEEEFELFLDGWVDEAMEVDYVGVKWRGG